MFSTKERIENKSTLSGKGRFEYLQALVTEFQDTSKHGEMNWKKSPPPSLQSAHLGVIKGLNRQIVN